MKQSIKEFVKRSPLLLKFYRNVKLGSTFKPTVTKSVKGSGNKLEINNSALFAECKINITGNNNEIIIKESTQFVNVAFVIFGSNNKIIISQGVTFDEGGSFWIEDENCEITIGENTSFRNTDIAATEPYSKITIGSDCLFFV